MADVFLSYTHSERDRLVPLVTQLTLLGLSVWFDVRIPTGTSYEEVIATELEVAKTVVVCWSQASTKSKWVRSEAAFALDQGQLIPCFLERCQLKPPFNMTQTEDLSNWNGDVDFPAWRKLVERIGSLIGRPGLLSLMDALAEPKGERLGAWIKAYPNDPYVTSAEETWQSRQREGFARELEVAAAQFDRAVNRHLTRGKSRLAALGAEMNLWLARGRDAEVADRPHPDRLLQSLLNRDVDGHAVDPDVLAVAVDQAKSMRDLAEGLEQDKLSLRSEIADLSQRAAAASAVSTSSLTTLRQHHDRAIASVNRRHRFVSGGLAAGLAAICAFTAYGAIDRARWIATAERYSDDLRTAQGNAASMLDELRRQNERSLTAQRMAEQGHGAALPQVADAEAQLSKPKVEKPSLNTALLRPPSKPTDAITIQATLPAHDATTTCTRDAGSIYDRDNTTGQGTFEMSVLDEATLKDAVSSCTRALVGLKDVRQSRRMLAQLGRAQLATAIMSKKAGDDRSADVEVQAATDALQLAEQKGSSYAMSLLGTFYQGIPGQEAVASASAFGNPDRTRAIDLYKRAAEQGDPSAMTNLARVLLDKSVPGDFDEPVIVDLLDRAEAQHFPRAFDLHSNAWLDPRMYAGKSDVDRRRHAAALLEQEQCLGFKDEVDKAFTRSPLLVAYRTGTTCS